MPLFRLIGLALFITAIFLALAAAITKTTYIRIQLEGKADASQPNAPSGSLVFPPSIEPGFGSELSQAESNAIQYTSVPILWPLVIAAGVGLLMWFMLPSETRRPSSSATQRSRRPR